MYGTLRYGTLHIDTYGSTVRCGFLRYITLREGGKPALVLLFSSISVPVLLTACEDHSIKDSSPT